MCREYDTAVIGAGPSGIMASITASRNGKRVALIEKNPHIGRKLLSTGNGRCNITNTNVTPDRYHGADAAFVRKVISQFDQHATMQFFRDLGLVLKEEDNGRVFPRTNQASSVVEVLGQGLSRAGVHIVCDAQVTQVDKTAKWTVCLADGRQLESKNVIIATGGRAAHHLGSTGDGLHWARKLGHSITPTYAALVPVETVESWPCEAQGTRVEARVWATCGGKTVIESSGDLLFTSYGLSGSSVMALAGTVAPLVRTTCVMLHIDLYPDFTEEQLRQTVLQVLANGGDTPIRNLLAGLLPNKLIPVVLEHAGHTESDRSRDFTLDSSADIARTMKNLTVTVSKLRPLKEAQVTSGGVNTEEIDPHSMQSKLVNGLFFAGEVLNVDGDSGGFNLQWAWSSGYVAGMLTG